MTYNNKNYLLRNSSYTGGGSTPWPQPKYVGLFFLLKKRKRCRMIWNGKIRKNILWHFCKGILFCDIFARVSYTFFPYIFIKYCSEVFFLKNHFFFIKNISFIPFCIFWYAYRKWNYKKKNYFFFKSLQKTVFAVQRGGGYGMVWEGVSEHNGLSVTNSFFYAFPKGSRKI